MTSNFALSLASDGLRLLHRVEGGWLLVGEVPATAPDLSAALARLRRRAETLAPEGLRTKLLIPNDQVRYLSLDTPRASEGDIREALQEALPEPLDGYVWDHARGGGRTYVAAVPQDTLAEAEAFAAAHRFHPVSFAAVPAPFTFRGEAYFGPTSRAGADADQRDAQPVTIIGEVPPEAGIESAAPAVSAPPPWTAGAPGSVDLDTAAEDSPPAVADAPPAAAEGGPAPTRTPPPEASAPAPTSPPSDPEPPSLTPEELSRGPSPDDVDAADSGPDLAEVPETAPEEEEAILPEPQESPPDEPSSGEPPAPRPPLAAEPRAAEPEPAFASRSRVARAPDRAAPPPLVRPAAAAVEGASAAFVRRRDEPPVLRPAAAPPPPSRSAPAITGEAAEAAPSLSPRTDRGREIPVTAPIAPASSRLPASLRDRLAERMADASAEPAPPPARRRTDAAAEAAEAAERDRLTVFGARGSDSASRIGGKPRYLGLILTLVLLLLMAAAAAWAAIGSERISAWLFGDDAVSPAVASADADLDEAADAEPPRDVTALLPSPDAMEDAPAADPEAEADLALAPPEDELLPPETDEVEVVPGGRPTGTVPSPAEAERFYAATGVWIRGPRLPLLPRSETMTNPSAVEPSEPDLPEAPVTDRLAALAPDPGLGRQPVPPPAGTVFARDERGFFLATPEGTETPYGMLIYAGEPDLVPPTRPGTEPPPIPPTAEVEVAALEAAPDAGEAPQVGGADAAATDLGAAPTLAGAAAPDAMPGIVTEATEPGAARLVADAGETGDVAIFAGAPQTVPPTRPGTEPPALVADARADLPADALALADTTPEAPAEAPEDEPVPADATDAAPAETLPVDVVAALPPVTPPTRPGTPPAPAEPEVADAAPALADGPVDVATLSGSPAAVPPVRPGTEAPTVEEEAPEAVAEAETASLPDGPVDVATLSGSPAAVPPVRPGTEAPTVEEESPAAVAEAETTSLPDGPVDVATRTGAPAAVPPVRPGTEAPVAEEAAEAVVADAQSPATDGAATPPGGVDLAVLDGTPAAVPPERTGDAPAAPAAIRVEENAPPAVPPTRPGTASASSEVAAPEAAVPQVTGPDAVAGTPEVVPPARPGLTLDEAAATPGAVTLEALTPFDGPRPEPRDAAAAPETLAALPAFDGPRPGLRPEGLAPEGAGETDADAVAEAVAEAAEDLPPEEAVPDVSSTLAAIVAGAPDPLAGATPQAVPRARRPDTRPANFDRVVARAAEANARSAPPAQAASTQAPTARSEEADDEPEQVAAAPAPPSGPTPGGVAGAATAQDAINLRDVNLIGVYGRPSDRRALIRLANGRYVRVSVGDRLEGGQVTAIGDDALNYVVRGQTYYLQIPDS
ncbi:hypothetical protein [Wenxinia marina]|uniref:Type IV pilus biogenesis n=1 Tax=Wenxinia marina DSM 24838 TaxID=1123501 RepID=A0A0D0NL66_9RHOB|nr:hypothetical protein [Wenxinia marina]KIQ69050.1 hypothetical protein Wenmar_02118 [Wenxinia marina DSM 24838]GGL69960.1 hypothetical protein GCM10011392_25590 [Wenxinia marina]